MIKLILIITLLGNLAYAEDTVFLNQNDKAPFSGYLFTESKTKEIRNQLIEREEYKGLVESYEKTDKWLKENLDLKDKQLTYAMERMDNLSKTLQSERTTSNWERVLWISLGIAATGLAGYAFKEINSR